MSGWIGFDLDGTLAKYDGWVGNAEIGEPVKPILDKLLYLLDQGHTVKIFTARVAGIGVYDMSLSRNLTEEDVLDPIREWCRKHIGQELEITNVKDFGMKVLYDDRCVAVEPNTGRVAMFCGGELCTKI